MSILAASQAKPSYKPSRRSAQQGWMNQERRSLSKPQRQDWTGISLDKGTGLRDAPYKYSHLSQTSKCEHNQKIQKWETYHAVHVEKR